MRSAIYRGQLRHRRFAPRPHAFAYDLFMMYVDLSELDSIFASRWFWSTRKFSLAWLRRSDYLGDANISLEAAVRDRIENELGVRPTGPIRMLTHLRYFGLSFNPITVYYCFDSTDSHVETIVTEITNTPWHERHAYVLRRDRGTHAAGIQRHRFAKQFHVSPFMSMDVDYDWRFSDPTERLNIHMENMQAGSKTFDATLTLNRQEISTKSLAAILSKFPFMTLKVVAGIYWQALCLWLKRIPFHSHPVKTLSKPL